MSKFYKIFILVILVTAITVSLFAKFRVGREEKTEKPDVVTQTTTVLPEPKREEVVEVRQEEKQKDEVDPPNLNKEDPKVEIFTGKELNKVPPKLMLITTSKACDCTLKRCQQGELTTGEVVRQFSGKVDYEMIDYAKETEKVNTLAKRYKLKFLPTLLFFGNDGELKSRIEGLVDKTKIEEELSSLGVK